MYSPHGAPSSYQYEQVSGIWNMARTNVYNPRLQLANYLETNVNGTQVVNATLNWVSASGHNNGNLQSASYVHGATGTPATMTFNQSYTYDTVNRLTSVTDSSPSGSSGVVNWSRTFGYDAYGNMWVPTGTGNTPTSINSFTANNQIFGSSYDAAGNQTNVNGSAQTYDAENRQATVAYGGATENYVYDGDGRRVSKFLTGGSSTVFVYDAAGQMAAA